MSSVWRWTVLALLCAGAIASACYWAASFRAKQLTFGSLTEAYAAVSPDGKWLAYELIREENSNLTQIWIMSMHEGFSSARRLTPIGMWSSAPSWSNDSNWISFVGDSHATDPGVRVARQEIYRLNVYTNEMVQLTHFDDGGVGPHASWSSSGWIAFERDGDIFGVRDDGSQVAQLLKVHSLKPGMDFDLGYLSWSPDSKQIAFSADDTTPSGEPRSAIWVGDVSTGQIRQVSFGGSNDTDLGPDWLNTDELVFMRWTKSDMKVRVSLLDLRTGKVLSITSGSVDWLPHVTPDHGHIVFERVKDLSQSDPFNFMPHSHIFQKRVPRNQLEGELFKRF